MCSVSLHSILELLLDAGDSYDARGVYTLHSILELLLVCNLSLISL